MLVLPAEHTVSARARTSLSRVLQLTRWPAAVILLTGQSTQLGQFYKYCVLCTEILQRLYI